MKEYVDNPVEYYDLKNNTNISHIIKCFKNLNESVIKKRYKSSDKFIDWAVNFTDINNQTSIDSDVKYIKFFNILIVIVFPIDLIMSIFFLFNSRYKFIQLKFVFILLIIIIIFNILCVIAVFWEFLIIKRLTNSFKYFVKLIKICFRKKISGDEIMTKMYDSEIMSFIIFFILVVIMFRYISKCCDLRKEIDYSDTQIEYFNRRNNDHINLDVNATE